MAVAFQASHRANQFALNPLVLMLLITSLMLSSRVICAALRFSRMALTCASLIFAAMERAVEFLMTTSDRTYMIAGKVGYADANYFSYVFKKQFGMSPTRYRTEKINR